MLSPLALSLRIELTSPTNCKCLYKDCIASLRFLKLSLHHSIVNITEFHLDSDYDLCTYIASNQEELRTVVLEGRIGLSEGRATGY